jgi:hypothetical protein
MRPIRLPEAIMPKEKRAGCADDSGLRQEQIKIRFVSSIEEVLEPLLAG